MELKNQVKEENVFVQIKATSPRNKDQMPCHSLEQPLGQNKIKGSWTKDF